MQEPGHLSSRKYFTRTEDQGSGSSPGHSSTYSMPPPPPKEKRPYAGQQGRPPGTGQLHQLLRGKLHPRARTANPSSLQAHHHHPEKGHSRHFIHPEGVGGGSEAGRGSPGGGAATSPAPPLPAPRRWPALAAILREPQGGWGRCSERLCPATSGKLEPCYESSCF